MSDNKNVIVVGSGLGGLCAAATLARQGFPVKVFERHTQPGGYATTFYKDRFEFEVSLHAISGVGTDEDPGPVLSHLKQLGVASKVDFINLDNLYTTIADGMEFVMPSGYEAALEALCTAYPHERAGFESLFKQIRSIGEELQLLSFGDYSRSPVNTIVRFPHVARAAGLSLGYIMDKALTDPRARLAIGQLWGYFGLPPAQLSLLMFAAGFHSYVRYGAATIKGKSQSLSNAFVEVIREAGGEVFTAQGISKIHVDAGQVKGVTTDDGERLDAEIIVSSANPITVCTQLIDPAQLPGDYLKKMTAAKPSVSAVSVYMGMNRTSRQLGFSDHELYLNRSIDFQEQYESCLSITEPLMTSLCACDFSNPAFSPDGSGVVALTALSEGKAWEKLNPSEYLRAKETLADQMISQAEEHIPGLRGHIETFNVATPVTNMRYTGNPEGAIYGFAMTPEQNPGFRLEHKGPVKGLWFAGAWSQPGGGYQPVIGSGASAASAIVREYAPGIYKKRKSNYKPYRSLWQGYKWFLRDAKHVGLVVSTKYKVPKVSDPVSLLQHDIDEVIARYHLDRVPLMLEEKTQQTPDTHTLRLVRKDGPIPPFSAGQYFNLFIEKDGVVTSRPYSVSSSPSNTDFLEITIKEKRGGFVSSHLLSELNVGDSINVSGPWGSFSTNEIIGETNLVGITVGSGITPFMSIIEEIERSGKQVSMQLIFGSRELSDIIFHKRLEELAEARPWLTLVPVLSKPGPEWGGETGRINDDVLTRHLGSRDHSQTTYLVCGPRALYRDVLVTLGNLGVDTSRVRLESYSPSKKITEHADWPADVSVDSRFDVRVPGREAPIVAIAGESLLVTLERAGVYRPAICRSDSCDSCKMSLLDGRVLSTSRDPNYQGAREDGHIRTCCSYPLSNLVLGG